MVDTEAIAGTQPLQQWKPNQGGFRATIFIFMCTGFENMGFIANMASMVLYFLGIMNMNLASSANTLTNFLGSAFLLSLIGGFISDTYLTRLTTCLIFGVVEILGYLLLTIQAHYSNLKPPFCPKPHINCIPVSGGDKFMLYSTLCLIALGSGGVRGSLPALGADQFNPKDPKEKKALARYFNYLLLSITAGACFGVTLIAYYSVYKSWAVGFLISMIGVCLAFIFVVLGRPFYRVVPFGDSPIITITKVIVAAFRNRKLVFPENHNELYEVSDKELSFDQEKIPPTDQFRCLGKASIIRENSTPEPWTVCTVTQVEEVKILTRMLPIIFSTVIMNTCLAQLQTFSVQQGYIMQLTVGKFDVPPTAIPVIPLFFMSILVPIYEFLFIPFARKYTKHPNGISQLQRVGVGLVLSIVSMTVAGLVEVKRRNHANSHPPEKISLLWLSFQYGIFGIADMFTLVGLLDFFYQEAPSGMKSLSTSFTFLSLSLGYYLSGVFVDIINAITERVTENKKGWLHGNNLNTNNVNLFYWFLAILSCLNFANYLYWASWYKYKNVDLDFKPKLKASNESPLRKEEETNEGVEERRISASSPEYKEIIKVKGEKTEESQVGEALKHIKNQS